MTVNQVKPTGCEQCDAHDAETKHLMRELFDQDEVGLLCLFVAGGVKVRASALAQVPPQDIKRLAIQRDLDFTSQLLGKLFIAFEPLYRQGIVKELRRMGMAFDVRHQPCPHGNETLKIKGLISNTPLDLRPPQETI